MLSQSCERLVTRVEFVLGEGGCARHRLRIQTKLILLI